MTDHASTAPRELPLLIGRGPGANAPETLLLIGVPDAQGVVHVRAWTADNWSSPPSTRAERAAALLTWLEAQANAGRSMNQSLYAVQLWLRGEGTSTR